MFVRKKHNPSGTVTICVIDKSSGKFNVIKNFGTARTEREVRLLTMQAKKWVSERMDNRQFSFEFETCLPTSER